MFGKLKLILYSVTEKGNAKKKMIDKLCIFFILVFVYLLYNAYSKTVLYSAKYTNKSPIAKKDYQSFGVGNDQEITLHDRVQASSSNLAADEYSRSNATELVFNKIFWSHLAESYVPKGVSFEESMSIINNIRSQAVKTLQKGNSSMCGDEHNAIVGLQDGTVICARYTNHDFFVYAEVLAFYLSRMLQMDSVPEVVLASTNKTSGYWNAADFNIVSWKENRIISMMRRIKDVTPNIYEPEIMKEAYRNGQIITGNVIRSSKIEDPSVIADIIQWGNMLVFDSLIGHYDRLYFWQKGKKNSNSGVLHNAVKSSDGKMWLVDHEKTFFYYVAGRDISYNFIHLLRFHEKRLKTICVFQYSLVYELQKLSEQPSPFQTFWNFTRSHEPLLDTMKKDYRFQYVGKLFDRRLSQILEWIKECKEVHS